VTQSQAELSECAEQHVEHIVIQVALNWMMIIERATRKSQCELCELCASVVGLLRQTLTTETQSSQGRNQATHRFRSNKNIRHAERSHNTVALEVV
jgi:hypothetical protein